MATMYTRLHTIITELDDLERAFMQLTSMYRMLKKHDIKTKLINALPLDANIQKEVAKQYDALVNKRNESFHYVVPLPKYFYCKGLTTYEKAFNYTAQNLCHDSYNNVIMDANIFAGYKISFSLYPPSSKGGYVFSGIQQKDRYTYLWPRVMMTTANSCVNELDARPLNIKGTQLGEGGLTYIFLKQNPKVVPQYYDITPCYYHMSCRDDFIPSGVSKYLDDKTSIDHVGPFWHYNKKHSRSEKKDYFWKKLFEYCIYNE